MTPHYFGYPVSNPFRSKTPRGFYDPIKGHTGIDLIMPQNTEIKSPCDGVVVEYRTQSEMGRCLYVQDGEGNIHVFAHLTKTLYQKGDKVKKDTVLALSGNTGSATTAPHLHYEIIAQKPAPGLEMMTRELSPFKGWNIDPEAFLSQPEPKPEELSDLEWCTTHLPEVDWSKIDPVLYTAFRSLAKRVVWR